MNKRQACIVCLALIASLCGSTARAADPVLLEFKTQALCSEYYSEGAGAGDLNNDGAIDVVYGPHWYEGPAFTTKHEIYAPKPQNREAYADHFFAWVYDFDRDGWQDVFVVGFPGTPAYVYKNPGLGQPENNPSKAADPAKSAKSANPASPASPASPAKSDPNANSTTKVVKHWTKHRVFDWVSNESPQLVNIVGDETPELVCTRDGFFGYATIDRAHPLKDWTFHAVSEKIADAKFGHGLGIGDINGDDRLDLIYSGGWLEQPANVAAAGGRWQLHANKFTTAYGGAEMYAYDVDGDGDQDVITSLAAHDFGLAWYEQIASGEEVKFTRHDIMGSKPGDNKYGVVVSELHSVNMVDMDGDGLKDIVTGKTYYSHHQKSPMWDAGAVVVWFKLVRGPSGVDWIPYRAADDTGIGRQLGIFDLNQDKLPDILVGGMKGCHVVLQTRKSVDQARWQAAQPTIVVPKADAAEKANGVSKAASVDGGKRVATVRPGTIIEGESLKILDVSLGKATRQDMSGFTADAWSGNAQLWWNGAKPGAKLTLALPVESAGKFDLLVSMTKARDYGIVQLWLDDRKLGQPVDLFNSPKVISTGMVHYGTHDLPAGEHRLVFEITGANPVAAKAFMIGIDAVQLGVSSGELPKATDGSVLNLDFERGTLADWVADGDAFAGQPIEGDTVTARRSDMRSLHQGKFWIGTFERSADAVTGTLTSSAFIVDQPFATLMVGGGESNETRVELVDKADGKVIGKFSGRNSEEMRMAVVDLRPFQKREIFIRVVDNSKGPWGHINFDDFRLHKQQPGPLAPVTGPLAPVTSPLVADQYPFKSQAAGPAAAAMKVPVGFRVLPAAAEPDVKQPIAMAYDDKGRLWIAEAYEYPQRAKGDKGRDRILIFEDSDNDGTLDRSKVFAEGLNLISGMEVGFGGVWVGAAPYLMFIPDRNHDDAPDGEPEILLDGWGFQDTHETLNTFIWGPDGWLYGCHGVFTHSKVGKPGSSDKDRQPLNAGIWRYHPVRHVFEVFAHGTSNPWGVDFNDRGQAFLTSCVIPHLYHIIQGGRYERQAGNHFNPHTYNDIKTAADHLHYLGAKPHGGNGKSDAAGGGHAHAGAMIYLGGQWPAEYRDKIFMNNIHGQRLNMDVLNPSGSGYSGSHGADFLLTGDQASQILNLRYGPDGQCMMIDWYDMQACHLPDPGRHDRSNGRIYKIVYGESESKAVDLTKLTDIELANMVTNENDWYVRHSRRLLQERAAKGKVDAAAIAKLKQLASGHDQETRRLRAMWALACTGAFDASIRDQQLTDASPYVRAWAIQLCLDGKGADAGLLKKLATMAVKDPSPVVRLYLASAAGRLPLEDRWEIVTGLASHAEDAADPNLPLMIWYAAEPLADVDAAHALALGVGAGKKIPMLRDYMLRRIGAGADGKSLAILVDALGQAKNVDLQLAFLDAIRSSLTGQRQAAPPEGWKAISKKLSSGDQRVQALVQSLGVTFGEETALAATRNQLNSSTLPISERMAALESLLAAKDPKLVATLQTLLDDEALRERALAGLAQYNDARTAGMILERYSKLKPTEKRTALATLASRAEWAVEMLQAVESKRIPSSDLTADLVRQLQFLKSDSVADLVKRTWGTIRETAADKTKLIDEYKKLLISTNKPRADLGQGRAVFARTCQQCHGLFGSGSNIGPDLTGSNRSNLEYLLSNIVDPSAVMAKEYQPTIVVTGDGRIVTGILKGEDEIAIKLQTATALEIIPKDEIDDRKLSPQSMMPDDQLKQFSPQEVVSLVAYLGSPGQVPILADDKNSKDFFNGKDLTHWRGKEGLWSVENGELVGKTSGLKTNEFLISEMAASNFKLSFEVKLVGNQGNSGVQFRSEPQEHGVKGYQADIGFGWWGKLYEEEGRGLLWPQSGESFVKPGQWNQYEIVADGRSIQTRINGQLCVDLDDAPGMRRGVFALQLHSGGATEVRFRNFQLEPK